MLVIKEVFKNYKNQKVLNGVTFNVAAGEIKGLIGVNGAGKSTLVDIICGVKKNNSGEIFINGTNIKDKKSIRQLKFNLGYMPQRFSLFNDLSVEENLSYLCTVYNLDKSNIEKTMEKCHLIEHRKTLAKNLSGGYKQLLSLAGAIIHSPNLLILDEPTASMDPIFRRKFWKIINSFKQTKTTVLVITHYMEELVECDNFVCLSKGRVSFNGSLDEYKKDGMINIEQLLQKYVLED